MAEHIAEGREQVYIDESGFEERTFRSRGYSVIGKRCFDRHDWRARSRTNAIGALLDSCLLTVSLFTCTIDTNVFYAWVEQDLLPKLRKLQAEMEEKRETQLELGGEDTGTRKFVIIMDNATFHKNDDILLLFENEGHKVEYLPAYSPDLNPIEHKWAQAKAIRKQRYCSVDELFACFVFNHFIVTSL